MRPRVAPRHGQKQARPWLVSTAPEPIGQRVWDKVCDEREIRTLKAQETELDAALAAAAPYSNAWWWALRKLDRVVTQRLKIERRG